VVQYRGELITKEESLIRQEGGNPLLFYFSDKFDLDGNIGENQARYVNHSCEPNCEAVQQNGGIWLVAKREILPGEEITFNYGFTPEAAREHPCSCGSSRCIGFILDEAFWPQSG
jgi:uncharacterized protein